MPGKAGKEEEIKIFPSANIFLWLIFPSVIFLDRFSKLWVMRFYAEGEGFPVIPGFFHITRVNNTGAAFGLFRDMPGVLITVSAVFIAGILFFCVRSGFKKTPDAASFGWALVLSGAAGNLYDRLRYGHVVDFLDFQVWPVFNIADTSICAGVFMILCGIFFKPKAHI